MKRLESRYKGPKQALPYQIVKELAGDTSRRSYMIYLNKIRTTKVSGSGRFTKMACYRAPICDILDLCGVKYVTGNDAPRGGKTGDFIEIKTVIK